MQKRIPAVLMRGGTSKGLFFHEQHLPTDSRLRDAVILAAFGSPDPYRRQVDGVGGAVSTASKVAIIGRSADPGYDVVYHFGQVAIDRPFIDYRGNCGNISAAVGPFAVDEGLVPVKEPVTTVRIYQNNTGKLIVAEVPVKDGCYNEQGGYAISGVPGSGGKITLRFVDPGGSVSGRLLPTGRPVDTLEVPGLGAVRVTIIDAANPVVLVPAPEIGLTGIEIEQIDKSREIRERLEAVRSMAAVAVGLVRGPEEARSASPAVPKIACVSAPGSYTATNGKIIGAGDMDLNVRSMSMGFLHPSIAISGAVAVAGAGAIPGTVAFALKGPAGGGKAFRIGHPSGVMEVETEMDLSAGGPRYLAAMVGRTARRLMEGRVLVPERCWR